MEPTLYEEMGGAPFFEKLVIGFYEGVKTDPVLKPMYPEEDFKGAVAYFSTDLSAYVTGQNLMVDGGWTAW